MRDGYRAPAEVSSLVESPRIGRVNFINQLGGLTDQVERFCKEAYQDPAKS